MRNIHSVFLSITLALSLALAAGCSTGSDSTSSADQPTALALDASALTPLANDFHYEGWILVDGAPLTTGKFNVDEEGVIVDLWGQVIPGGIFEVGVDLSDATDVILTIEPAGDTDTIPSETHYVAGGLEDGQAHLTVAAGAALGDDFQMANGTYILATPTDGMDTNERSGVWFVDIAQEPFAPSLDLPELPEGWEYEGWAVIDGVPVTTGRFTARDMADAFNGFSGEMMAPPFPGEDFLVNAPEGTWFPTELSEGKVVISIEPSPDDSPAPFLLKPLVGDVPVDALDHAAQSLDNHAESFPSVTASLVVMD